MVVNEMGDVEQCSRNKERFERKTWLMRESYHRDLDAIVTYHIHLHSILHLMT